MDLLLEVPVVVRVLLLETRRSAAAAVVVEGDLTTRTAVERVVSDENMFFCIGWFCKVFCVCVSVRERFIVAATAAEGERKVDRQTNCLYSCRMEKGKKLKRRRE